MKDPLHYTAKEFSALEGRIIRVKLSSTKEWISGRISNLIDAAHGDVGAVGCFDFHPTNETREKAKEKGFEIPTNLTPMELDEIDASLEYGKDA